MTATPPTPERAAAPSTAAATPPTTPLSPSNAAAAEELRAVRAVHRLMAHALSGKANPTERSTTGILARLLLDVAQSDKEDPFVAPPLGDTTFEQRLPRAYEAQPIGVPEADHVVITGDDMLVLFGALHEAVRQWDDHSQDTVDANHAAHRRLNELLDALKIANRLYLEGGTSLEKAHHEDDAAAEEWKSDRWLARSRPERFTPRGSTIVGDETTTTAPAATYRGEESR